jgi:hypothetical protein
MAAHIGDAPNSGERLDPVALQHLLDLSIGNLPEIRVPFTDCEKWFGYGKTDALVGFSTHAAALIPIAFTCATKSSPKILSRSRK